MAVVFSPGVVEIAVIQTQEGKPCVNVWHMKNSDEVWGDGLVSVVEDFRDNWQDHVLELQNADVELLRFEYRSIDPSDNRVGVVLPNSSKNTVGQGTGDASPPNVALLLHKRTPDRPRGRRDGRCFLPGVSETIVTGGGVLDGTWRTAQQAVLDQFYSGISDSSVNWAGDSYPVVLETTPASRAPGTGSVTISSRRVTSITLDPVVATQRERLR